MKKSLSISIICGLGMLPAAPYAAGTGPAPSWSREPVMIETGGKPLDTGSYDQVGHAAPFLGDIDADGRRELVVGSFSGQFRLFMNTGTDKAPTFSADSKWLM